MRFLSRFSVLATSALLTLHGSSVAQDGARVSYLKPQYLPPGELARVLGVREADGHGVLIWQEGDVAHRVELRRNDPSNLLIVLGASADVAAVEAMVKAVDVPPRQILIEAKVVEVNESKALDAGIDWSSLRADVFGRESWARLTQNTWTSTGSARFRGSDKRNILSADATLSLANALRLLDEKGAATFRDAPRILTLNNRRATILDGQRVTYVTRYSSFTNLFETDTLDAGLTLSVLPSLGESGYLTLDLRAELTTVSSNISGSPVKDGQIVENTVIVRDGETVLIGGFLRTVEERSRRRFPILGQVLPFLFSRETSSHSRRESFVVITPHVVDLAAAVDPKTREILEGGR